MYSDKVEVLRFETEPYRKHLDHNGSLGGKNGALHYNNNHLHHHTKHIVYHNGYHNTLIEAETKSPPPTKSTTATTAAIAVASAATLTGLHHHAVQPPSDPIIASVLHSRNNPRPGRLILENVNNRPTTMDRGTQANTEDDAAAVVSAVAESPSTSNELYRNANIGVTNKKLMSNGGDNSSVDSLNSADSAKRDSDESVIELAEFHQPMITKDEMDGHLNMSNGDGKHPGMGGKLSNGTVKDRPVDDDNDMPSCGMECLYFAMQCCECTIM